MNGEDHPRQLLARYTLRYTHRVQYSDMDAFRHINNVAVARYFEEGRASFNIEVFGVASMIDPPEGLQLLFACSQIEFLRQAHYPGTVEVGTGLARIGTSSFVLHQAAFQAGHCFALGEAVMVKAVHGRPAALTSSERAAMQRMWLEIPKISLSEG